MEQQPLPLQTTIGKGPYAVDACRLIPQELLTTKPTDPFSVADQEAQLKKWRRQAIVLNFWQPAEEHPEHSKLDKSNLDQLRLYIARTPPEERCLCNRRPLDSLDDNWPESPNAVEERIKLFAERVRKAHEMKVRYLTKLLNKSIKDEEIDFIPDEEVRSLHEVFERAMKKRSL